MHVSGLTLVFGALFSLPITDRHRSDVIRLMYENSYIEEEYVVEYVNVRNELLTLLAENRRLRIELDELRENQRLRIEHDELREELMYYEIKISKAKREILFYQVGIIMACMMFIIAFFFKNY